MTYETLVLRSVVTFGSLLERSDRTRPSLFTSVEIAVVSRQLRDVHPLEYGLDRACDLVKTAHNVGGASSSAESQRESSMFVCRRERRFAKFIIVVVDVQHRLASEPHCGCSLIVGRHPEITGFEVCLEYPALLCPK